MEFNTLHETEATNSGSISAGSSVVFFSSENNRAQITLNQQSFNHFEIVNDSDSNVDVDFDAPATDTPSRRRRVFAKGSLVIEAKDNFFFNSAKITNRHASNSISAGEVKANARIMKRGI